MKHNGSKRNSWQHVQNFAEIPTVNLAKNLASHRKSWRDSQQDRAKILAAVNFLLSESLGKIRSRILARFWPPGFWLPCENLGEICGSRRDFSHQEFHFPERILPGSRRESKSRQPKSHQDIGGIPAKIAAGSRQNPSPYFKRDCPFHTRLIRQGVMQPSLSELEV